MSIDEVVKKTMQYIWDQAVEDYQNGEIKTMFSLLQRPMYVRGFFKVEEGNHDAFLSTCYQDGYKVATLHVDKNREVLKMIFQRCASMEIEYALNEDDDKRAKSVSLKIPYQLVRKVAERRNVENSSGKSSVVK